MPAGYDFICKNEKCSCYETGFTLHGRWPVKSIDDAILSETDGKRKQALIKRKEEGRQVSLFVFPDDKDKKPIGFRIQCYCKYCNKIEDKDFIISEEDIGSKIGISPLCSLCGQTQIFFEELSESDIECPSCSEVLTKLYWFAKQS